MTSAALFAVSGEFIFNNSRISSRAVTPQSFSNHAQISRSSGVVVGDFKTSVSEINPPSKTPAVPAPSGTPASRNIFATSVQVLPTTSPVKRIGLVVPIVPMRW